MGGPEKPFSCPESGCGASFTNEDRLAVHAKKHDMVLQLGNKGGAFVDQTPTPTRFIRNCEEVGLFQDLQNVNPFDETFKRAMEARSESNQLNLEEHLNVNSDDTLHTPLIFPHLPDDNTATIYGTDGDQRGTLRMSSDEGSNHLSVVKCISSSAEDNLNLQDHDSKLLGKRFLKRKSDSTGSKSNKLVRQHSIDIADIAFETDKSLVESEKCHSAPLLQIPVISISEASDPKNDKDETETVHRNDSLLTPNRTVSKDSFDLIKGSFTKLISQRSIYMELDKLTSDTQKGSLDINVSIDDIPSLHMGSNDSVIREPVVRQRSSVESKGGNRKKLNLSLSNDTDDSQKISTAGKIKRDLFRMSKNNDISDASQNSAPSSHEMPVIENLNGQPMVDSNGKGVYELLLKWPDGQKIYLKEVYREKTNNKESKPDENIKKQVNTKDLKRKLKEVIEKKTTINKNIQTQPVILPENCIIIPQLTHVSPVIMQNKLTPQPLNVQLMSVLPQEKLQTPTILVSNALSAIAPLEKNATVQESSHKLPVIQSNKKPTVLLPSILPSPSNKDNCVQSVIKTTKNYTQSKTDSGSSKKNISETSVPAKESNVLMNSKDDIQKRNRAAVHRYRMKKNAMVTALQQNHKKLNEDYKILNQKFQEAMNEIKRLRSILSAHADCPLSKQ